jgi:hypothetical protein
MKKKDRSIRNSVIAMLIASTIIAAVKPLREITLVFLKLLWENSNAFSKHLVSTAIVPYWLIYVVIIILLLLFWSKAKRVITDLSAEAARESPLAYKKDCFYGMVWRWLMDSDFQPYRISTFCPKCDMQIHSDSAEYEYSTQFYCDKCGFKSEAIKMKPFQLEEWVIREIQRKLRTKEWKQGLPK